MPERDDQASWRENLHLLGWSALLAAITVVLNWRTPKSPPSDRCPECGRG